MSQGVEIHTAREESLIERNIAKITQQPATEMRRRPGPLATAEAASRSAEREWTKLQSRCVDAEQALRESLLDNERLFLRNQELCRQLDEAISRHTLELTREKAETHHYRDMAISLRIKLNLIAASLVDAMRTAATESPGRQNEQSQAANGPTMEGTAVPDEDIEMIRSVFDRVIDRSTPLPPPPTML